jgi:hypothetical protein
MIFLYFLYSLQYGVSSKATSYSNAAPLGNLFQVGNKPVIYGELVIDELNEGRYQFLYLARRYNHQALDL